MKLLAEKEKIRAVYRYTQEDPLFDTFYTGLMFLSEGEFTKSEEKFLEIVSNPENHNLMVYKYLILSMLAAGKPYEEAIVYAKKWELRAHEIGSKREQSRSTITVEILMRSIERRKELNENKSP
jgi:hypothetical protein